MVNPIGHWLRIPFGTRSRIPFGGLSGFRGIGFRIPLRGLSGFWFPLGMVVPALFFHSKWWLVSEECVIVVSPLYDIFLEVCNIVSMTNIISYHNNY